MQLDDDRLQPYILRHIASSVRCASCQRSYAPEDLEVVARHAGMWFVRVSCDHCQIEGLVMVVLEVESDAGRRKPAAQLAPRALLPAPDERDSRANAITKADVQDVARFLESYRGNLSEFLGDA